MFRAFLVHHQEILYCLISRCVVFDWSPLSQTEVVLCPTDLHYPKPKLCCVRLISLIPDRGTDNGNVLPKCLHFMLATISFLLYRLTLFFLANSSGFWTSMDAIQRNMSYRWGVELIVQGDLATRQNGFLCISQNHWSLQHYQYLCAEAALAVRGA
jgi:hypothetical protein